MSNFYTDPNTGISIDMTYYRQDPWQAPESFMNLPQYPQSVNELRNRIERQLRAMLQGNALDNQLRAYLYHQMCANNYINNDWGALVTSSAQLMEAEVGRGTVLTETNFGNILARAIQVYLVRAVERDPNLANTLSNEQYQTIQQLAVQRNLDVELVESFNAQRAGHLQYPQQQNVYGANNLNRQNNFVMNQVNTTRQPIGGLTRPPVQQAAPVANRTRSFEDIIASANETEQVQHSRQMPSSRPTDVFNNLRNTNPEEVSARAEGRSSPVLEEVHLSPHSGYHHQLGGEDVRFDDYFVRSEETPMPDVVENSGDTAPNFATIMIDQRPISVAYNFYRHFVNETGGIMKYEDHELRYQNIAPVEGNPILPVYKEPEFEGTGELVQQEWLTDATFELLNSPLVGMNLDTAMAAVTFRENVAFNRKVSEFIVSSTDAVLINDMAQFKELFGGLYQDSPETNLHTLWNLVRDLEGYSQPLYRKLNRAATEACNVNLGKILGLTMRIDSYADDWMDLLDHLLKTHGQAQHDRFVAQMYRVHAAICSLAGEKVHYAMLKHNSLFDSLSRQVDLIWDPENDTFRTANEKEREALLRFLTEIEGPLGFKDTMVQIVKHDYCCLVPVVFDQLGLELDDGMNVVYPSVLPELTTFLRTFVEHAGGFDGLYSRIIVGTIDGVLMEVLPLPGVDDHNQALLGLVEITE